MFKNIVLPFSISCACFIPMTALGESLELKTIADATKGTRTLVDVDKSGSASQGDILVFDQPLLDEKGTPIGTNSGFCITVLPNTYYQCQWTLTMDEGSITVGGQEAEKGQSTLSVIGGTGIYEEYRGVMISEPQGDNTYSQIVKLRK